MKSVEAQLIFQSFDGGGPSFDVLLDKEIVSYGSRRVYAKSDHEDMSGAGYDVVYTFKGISEGETNMTVKERSPIAGNFDHYYLVKVDSGLNVTIEKTGEKDIDSIEDE